MSTNYYAVNGYCHHCGRGDEEHIGKHAGGWRFMFHGTDLVTDFQSWLDNVRLADKVINEYGEEVPLEELLETIELLRNNPIPLDFISGSRLDADGNLFIEGYFC